MKKKGMIATCIIGVLVLGVVLLFFVTKSNKSSNDEVVFVTKVSTLVDQGSLGVQQRFSGVVEPQQVHEISLQPDRTCKEVLVEKGQEVSVGIPLFTYDTDQAQSDLSQAQLDLERLNNSIVSLNDQIRTLEKEKRRRR